MSLAPFADVEALINRGVSAMLPNAVATVAGGEPFGVIFDRTPVEPLGLMASYAPKASFELARAPGLVQTSVLHIDGAAYTVVSDVQPDSSGWVTLELREA